MSVAVVDLADVRASGRKPSGITHIDHVARAWAMPPDEAWTEARRYYLRHLQYAEINDASCREISALMRRRAAIYSRSAQARGKRVGVA